MEAFLAALMESLLPSAAEAGGASGMSEAVASGGMAPPSAAESLGSTIGGMGNQAISPTMDAYKTFTNPNATAGDMLQGTYKYAFSPWLITMLVAFHHYFKVMAVAHKVFFHTLLDVKD